MHWDPYLHAWVVTGYEDCMTVLHKFSADRTPKPEQIKAMGLEQLEPIAQVMTKQMLFMDAPAHTRLRKLCSAAFTSRRVETMRAQIHEIANRLIARSCAKGRMDSIADFAAPLPGDRYRRDCSACRPRITSNSSLVGRFRRDARQFPAQSRPRRTRPAKRRGDDRLFPRGDPRAGATPREGLIHSLMTAEVDGARLTEEEIIANTIVTMVGGQETTTNLIGNGMLTLLRNPSGAGAAPRRSGDHRDRRSRNCCATKARASILRGWRRKTSSWAASASRSATP